MVTLKRLLGEAGAGIDESFGHPEGRLYDVLKALVEAGTPLSASGDTTAAVKATTVVAVDGTLGLWTATIATTGSASGTTLVVNVNGTPVVGGTLVFDNTDADGIVKTLDLSTLGTAAAVVAGDLVSLEVTVQATASSGLTQTLSIQSVLVE